MDRHTATKHYPSHSKHRLTQSFAKLRCTTFYDFSCTEPRQYIMSRNAVSEGVKGVRSIRLQCFCVLSNTKELLTLL